MKYLVLLIVGLGITAGLLFLDSKIEVVAPVSNPAAETAVSSTVPSTSSIVAATSTPLVPIEPPLAIKFSSTAPIQGDTLRIDVSGGASAPKTATVGTETAVFFPFGQGYTALLGFKVTASSGPASVLVKFADGTATSTRFSLLKKNVVVENLSIPPSLGVTPEELVQKIVAENDELNAILGGVTPRIYFTGGFDMPLTDSSRITDTYGVLRKTGSQEIWHLGTDFAAASGTPVLAMNDGVVRFAENTFSYGNTVIIDHGEGIYSMYLHMSKILASVGKTVKKEQAIGLVGDTGFSTGEHLHISVKVNGVSVDPMRFLDVLR